MKELKFVDVGEGITEGHVQKWLVKDGDAVKEDQPIVKVETDKAVVDVPAPGSGIVKVVAKENSDVHVGDTIAIVGNADELKSAANAAVAPVQEQARNNMQSAPVPSMQPGPQKQTAEAAAAPSVRRLAEQLGVDINAVPGTGPHGRILENDVRAFASKSGAPAPQASIAPKFSELLEEQHKEEVERVPLTQTRKAIAKNMEASWTIPRASHMDLADASALFGVMQKEKGRALQEFGVKLSYFPFIIKAAVEALKENPHFNASYDRDKLEIVVKKYYNIGLAAEAPDGLKVVVVKDADRKSIMELAKEISELHKKVVEQSVTLDEMRDSTFTITNIGSLGGGFLAVPMINYPDVAILGVTMIRDWPVVENGMVKAGKVLPFVVTFDHRVVDGAEAVKMGNAFKKYIEDPEFLDML